MQRIWMRRLVFVTVIAWMALSPFLRQVVGVDSGVFRQWRMYGMRSVKECWVQYEHQQDGDWQHLSRWETLGFTFAKFPSAGQRSIKDPETARKRGRELCAHLGRDAAVRYRMRCGHWRQGWGEEQVSDDLCSARPASDSPAKRRKRLPRGAAR